MRKINTTGLNLIKEFEGLRLKAYLCPANVWTIGYGHTKTARKDMTVTEEEAERLLQQDLAVFERAVEKALKRQATNGQFAAFVSLAFNIGERAFKNSTALKRFNAGDLAGAAEALTWWNKATVNGKKVKLSGLVRRREAERVLFWSDVENDAEMLIVEEAPSKVEGGETKPLIKSRTVWGVVTAAGLWALENFGPVWVSIPDELKTTAPWLLGAVLVLLFINRVYEQKTGEH